MSGHDHQNAFNTETKEFKNLSDSDRFTVMVSKK